MQCVAQHVNKPVVQALMCWWQTCNVQPGRMSFRLTQHTIIMHPTLQRLGPLSFHSTAYDSAFKWKFAYDAADSRMMRNASCESIYNGEGDERGSTDGGGGPPLLPEATGLPGGFNPLQHCTDDTVSLWAKPLPHPASTDALDFIAP